MHLLDYLSTGPGRVIRVVAGLVLMLAGAALGGAWWALTGFGLLPLATGVFNICPISPVFGRSWRGNTCRSDASAGRSA